MKKSILILSVFSVLLVSCGEESTKEKELELRERELALKEKELDFKISNSKDKTLNTTAVNTDQKALLVKPFDDIGIRYEDDLDIKIIDKILVAEEEINSSILFEYTYSDKEPPLTFVSLFVAGDPYGIFVLKKPMDFDELQKNVKELNTSIFSSDELDPSDIILTKEGLSVNASYGTTVSLDAFYNIDDNGIIKKRKQEEYLINQKTVALESFDFYETKDLKKVKGKISENETLTLISTINEYFNTGGITKIKSKDGNIGWLDIHVYPSISENTPQLKDIEANGW